MTGGDPEEAKGDGIFLSHDERYEVTDEFLTVWRSAISGRRTIFKGKHIHVEGAKVVYLPLQQPRRLFTSVVLPLPPSSLPPGRWMCI